MRNFVLGIVGVFLLSGVAVAQCFSNNVCVQQQRVQKVFTQPVVQYVVPQYQQVQRVVEYVEVPKVRVVERVRVQPVVQFQKVQKQVVQKVKVVNQKQQVVRQRVVNRQGLLQRVRNVVGRDVQVQRVRIVNGH